MSIIVLDVELSNNTIWAAKFDFLPFRCSGYAANEHLSAEDNLENIVNLFRQVMIWRVREKSIILMPLSLIYMDWSALFCYYIKKDVDGNRMVSMCGDMEGFHLEPVDENIKLYNITDDVSGKWFKHHQEIKKIEETIPDKKNWNWEEASIVSYLYFIGEYETIISLTKPNIIVF